MKYPFEESEQLIYDFEELLKLHGLDIQKGSDLEKISFAILETNSKHKKEIRHDNSIDIREIFSDIAGLVDFVRKILRNRDHPDFLQLIPHLGLLNKAGTAVLTTKSRVTDDGNNKLMELYIALLCMRFATNIRLDHPNNSKGDNPDIMFRYRDTEWAIACKALHSAKGETLRDAILKGTEQITRSAAEKGIVIVNFKNIIDRDEIWPLLNEEEFLNGAEPIFACHRTLQAPIGILQSYGNVYREKVLAAIGSENLIELSQKGIWPSSFLIFLHAITSVLHEGKSPATILKTFNLIQFNNVESDHMDLLEKLNSSMHELI